MPDKTEFEESNDIINYLLENVSKIRFETFTSLQEKARRNAFSNLHKKENTFAEYQHVETMKDFILKYDRIHPVDRVVINNFNRKNGTNLEEVKMVYGNGANEITRANHALAVTVADTIFFRNGAYKPETEEGQKLLAHELTHAAQYKNRPLADNRTQDELETQAENSELNEEYDPDKKIEKVINNTKYSFTKKEWQQLKEMIKLDMEKWFEQQEKELSENDYLKFLINAEKWEEEFKKWEI